MLLGRVIGTVVPCVVYEGLITQIETSTWFGSQRVLELDGETL